MAKPKGIESPLGLARRLSLPFLDNPYLLTRALTHTSYLNEHSDVLDDNERLEFLGDAVLDLVITRILMKRFPQTSEGNLSRMRAFASGRRTSRRKAISRSVCGCSSKTRYSWQKKRSYHGMGGAVDITD